MPRSENSMRALRTGSSSWNKPTAMKTGVPWPELTVGRAVCATAQIEHAVDSV